MKNEYRNAFDYFENNERKYSFNHFFDMEKIGDETQMPVEFKNEEYIIFEGYLSNAKLLYRKLISKGKYCPDNLIYPYLFSCRHCIEILLKGIIKKFFYIINAYLIKLDDGILKKIQHTHSITNLLEYFESLTSNIDDYDVLKIIQKGNYKLLHEELLLDNKSDSFRYIYTVEGKYTSVQSKTINIPLFNKKFTLMIKSLDQLYKLGDYIYFDYETGTFTKSCSRYVLEYLSRDDLLKKLLLDKNKNVKEKLKQKYNFKSFREMYEAINKIKSSDFFAINITINFEKKDNVISEKIIDDIIQITKETTYENKKKLLDGMDRLSITHLFAYWNIGKKHSYPENLSKCFDFWNKDYYFGDDGYLLSKIDSDFLANLQKGLYICGQRTHYNYIKNLNNDQK